MKLITILMLLALNGCGTLAFDCYLHQDKPPFWCNF